MPSSSTDRRGFPPGDAGAWVRLSLVVVLGVGALVAPAIGLTGAIYTDSATVGFDVYSSPAPTPTPTTTTTTTTTTAAPTLAPAMLTAPTTSPTTAPTPEASPVVSATPTVTPDPTAAPSPTASPAPTTSPTATAPTGQWRSRTLWPVWPQPRGH